jgi:hypothetical protein
MSQVLVNDSAFPNGGLEVHGMTSGGHFFRMSSTPDAHLLTVDLDYLQADKLCLADGTGKALLLFQARKVRFPRFFVFQGQGIKPPFSAHAES